MKLLRLPTPAQLLQETLLPAGERPQGIIIGNFDGFHAGHQALSVALDDKMKDFSGGANGSFLKGILSFHPHPREYFSKLNASSPGTRPLYHLSTLHQKLSLAEQFGFSAVYLIRFNAEFASLSPEQFVDFYLCTLLRPKVVVVGHDWRFGKNRAAGVQELRDLLDRAGIMLHVVHPVLNGTERVSSQLIRLSLETGDMERASTLLTRPYTYSGRIIHGDKRGRSIGFPTANVYSPKQLTPKHGVYAVRAELFGKCYEAVANVGTRPTFQGSGRTVEVHLFSPPKGEFYGAMMNVQFLKYLREEKKYSSVQELTSAIEQDIVAARAYFCSK